MLLPACVASLGSGTLRLSRSVSPSVVGVGPSSLRPPAPPSHLSGRGWLVSLERFTSPSPEGLLAGPPLRIVVLPRAALPLPLQTSRRRTGGFQCSRPPEARSRPRGDQETVQAEAPAPGKGSRAPGARSMKKRAVGGMKKRAVGGLGPRGRIASPRRRDDPDLPHPGIETTLPPGKSSPARS